MKTQEKKIGGSTILLGEHKFNYSNIPGGRGKIFPGFWKGNMIAPMKELINEFDLVFFRR